MDRSWLVQKSKNVENLGNFGHISKNKTRNELLVFFRPVGPQDAMFGKTRFFQPFSSYSKVRGTQKCKIEKFKKFVENRRNFTNFGDFSLFNKHHPVRPEPAAVLARSNFIGPF